MLRKVETSVRRRAGERPVARDAKAVLAHQPPDPSGHEQGDRMSVTGVAERAPSRAADSPWAGETHGLTKRVKENVASDGVDLFVPRGCAFGYLGPTGAGKTTLIRVLLGLTHADAGTMSLLGYSVPH